jgi:hypothetical protein
LCGFIASNSSGRDVEGGVRGLISVNILEFSKRDNITTRNLRITNLETGI